MDANTLAYHPQLHDIYRQAMGSITDIRSIGVGMHEGKVAIFIATPDILSAHPTEVLVDNEIVPVVVELQVQHASAYNF
jgi:hypothetical protein